MKKNLKIELENLINYKFNSSKVLKTSLTHKSFNDEINNEKLEFLGDRVLGLVISKNLILKYPYEKRYSIFCYCRICNRYHVKCK